jgi:hypothetical protein
MTAASHAFPRKPIASRCPLMGPMLTFEPR